MDYNARMRTVLVADPNATFATVVSDALQRLGGFDVILASTGPEALEKATAAHPNIAVIDGALPDCRLPDLLAQLRQHNPSLPIVLMPVSPADIPAEIPIQGALTKPFFLPDLPALIAQLLGVEANPPARPGTRPLARPGTKPISKPRNARLAVTGPLSTTAPLRARLSATGMLPPAPPPPLTLSDELRRQVEAQIEAVSRALRDEPVFLAQADKVLVIVPRLSASATQSLVQVASRAWDFQAAAPEVIRFEGDTEINRYMLYSVRVRDNLTLSVALRMRIPLIIVRRVARDTATRLLSTLQAGGNNAGASRSV